MNNFYVYQHRRLDTNQVFYVGKGKEKRAYSKNRSAYWKRIVHKHGYVVEFVDINLDEQTAFELEVFVIKFYGRMDLKLGLLINKTDGGEGSSGVIPSEKTRKKLSVAGTGRKVAEETRAKLRAANIGRANMLGKRHTQVTKDKMSAAHSGEKSYMFGRTGDKHPFFGKTHSTEAKVKMSAVRMGFKPSLSTKFKISEAHQRQVVNQFGEVFKSIKIAAKWCGLSTGAHIVANCKGKLKSAGKHPATKIKLEWRYYDNNYEYGI